ncbi:MAG: HPr-rel-A system PqqD family peptide chaperone [Magnetococcales bacterium]|nr:HPr-rel-A system PqqD family peptide chaperone [Magnetococcales bacterium]
MNAQNRPAGINATPLLENATWCVPDYDALLWERYDEIYHLFNPGSGQTHIINDPAYEALKELSKQPDNMTGLLVRLELDQEPEKVTKHFRRLLWELDQLGLIVPVTS